MRAKSPGNDLVDGGHVGDEGGSRNRRAFEGFGDPRAIGGNGEVRVCAVHERSVLRMPRRRSTAVLHTPCLRRDRVPVADGRAEEPSLLIPYGRTRRDVEQRAKEVLRCGILIESTRQVGDRRLPIGLRHHRGVQEQTARRLADGTRLRRCHALEHLYLDAVLGTAGVPQGQRPPDLEEVVAGDAEADGVRVSEHQRALHHALVRRVDGWLRRVGRQRPVMHLGLDELVGEIGALDDADLGRGAALGSPCVRPGAQRLEGRMGVGDVGLKDDARRQPEELVSTEHPHEGLDAQFEVAVLLHVEIDEGPGRGITRGAVQPGELRINPPQRVIPGEDIQVRADRGDLHADVVHVGATDQFGDATGAFVGLVVAQDRLPEHIAVQPESISLPTREVRGERRVVSGQDDAGRVLVDPPGHESLRCLRTEGRHGAEGSQAEAVEAAQRLRNSGVGEFMQSASRPLGVVDAHDLIGEIQQQVTSVLIGQQAGQPSGSSRLLTRGQRIHEHTGRPLLGVLDQQVVRLDCAHARSQHR